MDCATLGQCRGESGFCPVLNRPMAPRQVAICAGTADGVSPGECERWRSRWYAQGHPFDPHASGRMGLSLVAPWHTRDCREDSWAGCAPKKPWEYQVVAAIPHLGDPEVLEVAVALIRLQTERPYIVIVDTGSSEEHYAAVRALAADDLEVHQLCGQGYLGSSECVMLAMDLVTARCKGLGTQYLYATHNDVFLKRRDFLAWLRSQCDAGHPAVGYETYNRGPTGPWNGAVGHCSTMLHMETMKRANLEWSGQRCFEKERAAGKECPAGWPDGEAGIAIALRAHGLEPKLIGQRDCVFCFERDENRDHVRAWSGAQVFYGPHRKDGLKDYPEKARKWMAVALAEARQRIAEWSGTANPWVSQAPRPASEWPWYVRAVARLRHAGDKGVGDTIHRNLARFGGDFAARLYKRIAGRDCGCSDRQAALNLLLPY